MVAAPVGFATWTFALPKTLLANFCGYQEIGTFIVLVATVGRTTVAYIMGKSQRLERSESHGGRATFPHGFGCAPPGPTRVSLPAMLSGGPGIVER